MAKRSTLNIAAEPALIYEILTDYENLAEWLPHVSKSRLLAREGDLALAELELREKTDTRFAMECVHSRDRMVVWRPIGKQVSVTQIEWRLETVADGCCRVTATADKPVSFSFYSRASRNFLDPDSSLKALNNQAGLFAKDDKLPEGSEKILEIVETAAGLVCWLRGKKYRLVAEEK
jgi:hypothetical protein